MLLFACSQLIGNIQIEGEIGLYMSFKVKVATSQLQPLKWLITEA
jgi:hypothetical protein